MDAIGVGDGVGAPPGAEPMSLHDAFDRYAVFFEGLSPETVGELPALCAPDVRFRDPFNDVTGIAPFRKVLDKMFEDTVTPRFKIIDRAVSGNVCYLRWDFTFRSPGRRGQEWHIVGMSEVHFDDAGRVTAHLDHWDSGAQLYERLPIVGAVVRAVRRKLAAD